MLLSQKKGFSIDPGLQKKNGKGNTKAQAALSSKEEAPSEKLKPKESPSRLKKCKVNSRKRKNDSEREIKTSVSGTQRTPILSGIQRSTSAKVPKHVTFEDSINKSSTEKVTLGDSVNKSALEKVTLVDSSKKSGSEKVILVDSSKKSGSEKVTLEDSVNKSVPENMTLEDSVNKSVPDIMTLEDSVKKSVPEKETFMDSVNVTATDSVEDTLSSITWKKDLKESCQGGDTLQAEKSGCINTVAPDETKDRLALDLARRFDPIRGHRLGKRPMYCGNADWSKDYVPVKTSKSACTLSVYGSGLKLRLDSETVSLKNKECKQSDKEDGSLEEKSTKFSSLSRLSSRLPSLHLQTTSVVMNAALPAKVRNLALSLTALACPAITSMSPSLPPLVHNSEEADVVSAQNELSTSSEAHLDTKTFQSSKRPENPTEVAKTDTASMLAQKLRDTFVSNSKGTQPQKEFIPQSLADVSKSDGSVSRTINPSPKVQRIIVKDCSLSPSVGKKFDQIGKSPGPRLQTVIVRKLPNSQLSAAIDSSSCSQTISGQISTAVVTESCLHDTLPPDQPRTSMNNAGSLAAAKKMIADSTASWSKNVSNYPAVKNKVENLLSPSTKSQSVLVKNCRNLFDNVFDSIKPPVLEKLESMAGSVSTLHHNFQSIATESSLTNHQSSKQGKNGFLPNDSGNKEEDLTDTLSGLNNNGALNSHLPNVGNKSDRDQSISKQGQQIDIIPPQGHHQLLLNFSQASTEHHRLRDNQEKWQQQGQQDSPVSGQDEVLLVVSPPGGYHPLLFDHSYYQSPVKGNSFNLSSNGD
ncbi:trans-Golgi network integral membrane protein 2 [Elysia marginata]|uniref:Trans-Golgi network integral membrane protein 2 n=1 Tax=Elysia marginata TaxID=1093978 RepID=A0AAV4EDK0_9GAST|nr:trans-Golgi network integral membrane protein 2 [Elysia marginata]